jgi:hypothetical protein
MRTDLITHVRGAANPVADPDDPATSFGGLAKRFCCDIPDERDSGFVPKSELNTSNPVLRKGPKLQPRYRHATRYPEDFASTLSAPGARSKATGDCFRNGECGDSTCPNCRTRRAYHVTNNDELSIYIYQHGLHTPGNNSLILPPRSCLLTAFKLWVIDAVEEFTPLAATTDLSLETWFDATNYPAWRKDALRRTIETYYQTEASLSLEELRRNRIFDVKSFIKDESYAEFKHSRIINSRSDEFKCIVGPLVKAIEHVVYEHPWFIKHTSVRERPALLTEVLGGSEGTLVDSDWSSMEANFTADLMESCEVVLLEHMCQNLPESHPILRAFKTAKLGINKCSLKFLTIFVRAKRMSGEMDTSLSNTITNMYVARFMCFLVGSKIVGFVEGDDGIFRINGMVPPKCLMEQFGIRVKMNIQTQLEHASFCGCIYTMEDNLIATDIVNSSLDLFWAPARLSESSSNKKKRYLRAKALSLAHQYPGCPVLGKLAQKVLYFTRSVQLGKLSEQKQFNSYDRDLLRFVSTIKDPVSLYREPSQSMRDLVFQVYGISVQDQLSIEYEIESAQSLETMSFANLASYANGDQKDYYERYVLNTPTYADLNSFF